jgi:hypothetical protein
MKEVKKMKFNWWYTHSLEQNTINECPFYNGTMDGICNILNKVCGDGQHTLPEDCPLRDGHIVIGKELGYD